MIGSISLGGRCDVTRVSLDTRQTNRPIRRSVCQGISMTAFAVVKSLFRFSDSKHFMRRHSLDFCKRVDCVSILGHMQCTKRECGREIPEEMSSKLFLSHAMPCPHEQDELLLCSKYSIVIVQ